MPGHRRGGPAARALAAGGLVGLALTFAACDGTQPCSSCPKVAGRYDVSYELDGGCGVIGQPPAELELEQTGANLKTQVFSVSLSGTFYEGGTFSLSGTGDADGGTASISLRGNYLPPSAVTDGGTWLRGRYRASQRPLGAESCAVEGGFLAKRR